MATRVPRRGVAAAVLVLGDLVLLEATVLLGILVRLHAAHWFAIDVRPGNFAGVAVAVVFLPLAYALAGLYPGYGQTGVERLRKRVTVTALCFGAMILFDRLALDGLWSRGILLMAGAVAVVAIPLWDAVAQHLLIRWGGWGEGVVVFGPEDRRRALADTLTRHRELGWIPVAWAERPSSGEPPVPGVGLALVALSGPGIVPPSSADDLPYRRVVIVPDIGPEMGDVQSLWISVRDLGAELGLEMRRNLLDPVNQAVKRALDVVFAAGALVLAAPVIAVCAAVVAVVSPGPFFYVQIRTGLHGRPFRMWKLRTMVPDAARRLDRVIAQSDEVRAEWERSMKLRNDPRVVPVVGGFMRRFSIDELPQLWNVLCGEMSLVGPRPLPNYHLVRLEPCAQRMRRRVRPGITGLWQVSGRSTTSLSEQQRLDTYYVRNWSLWLDIHILCRTLLVVVTGRGAW
ncbi:hypothetical protein TSO221_12195 [Azospirillum sp. TSO22-1]|nr:hypothetical protein TSO221_12195 [Azospirillum sp. TSO22-1]